MLPSPQHHYLTAALGWLDLGNYLEAERELEIITPAWRVHPDVLEVRWHLYAKTARWTAALEISSALREIAPEKPFGWIHQACSFHHLGRTEQAFQTLLGVVENFRHMPTIAYKLACYACHLNRLDEAIRWIEDAMNHGDYDSVSRMALIDPDLKPIRNWIGVNSANRRAALRSRKQRPPSPADLPQAPGSRFHPSLNPPDEARRSQ